MSITEMTKRKVSAEGMEWGRQEMERLGLARLTPEERAEVVAKSKPFSELREAVRAKLRVARKGK